MTNETLNLARCIGLREWHTKGIGVEFEVYFSEQRERLLRQAEALPSMDEVGPAKFMELLTKGEPT